MYFKLISLYITNDYIILNIKYLLIIYPVITNFFSPPLWPTTPTKASPLASPRYLRTPMFFILQKPLRCACPTSNQNALGVKYLLTYMVNWAIPSLTSYNPRLFGVDHQRLFDANMLSSSSVIFPFTSGSFDR